jgi:hypothetical protein
LFCLEKDNRFVMQKYFIPPYLFRLGFLLTLLFNQNLYAQPLSAKILSAPDITTKLLDCTSPPVIQCPVDLTLCPGATEDPVATGCAKAYPPSTQCNPPIVAFVDRVISSGPCQGEKTIQRIWTATDAENPALRSFCIQYLRFEDKTSPVFSQCPKDTSVISNDKCVALFQWHPPAISDHCGSVCVTSSHVNGSLFNEGPTVITYTANDACGNTSSCSFTVTVIPQCCLANPILICPPYFSACPDSEIDPATTGRATAEPGSQYCAKPLISFKDDTLINALCSLTIARTWTAWDPNKPELRSSCIQTIELKDLTPPTIVCPQNITVSSEPDCFATVNWNVPQTSDNCTSVTLVSSHGNPARFPVGTTTVFYTATDGCGNHTDCHFTITVEANCCNKPPVLTCPADFNNCPQGIDPSVTGTATATPGQVGCPQPVITYKDDTIYHQACSLRVIRTWIATDPVQSNLSASCDQIINLKDEQAPSITCPANITVQSGPDCTGTASWNDPITSDNCSSVSLSGSHGNGTSGFPIGTTTVYYTAFDACGNSSNCSFTVTVEPNCCNKPPVLTCPADFNNCPQGIDPSVTGTATATPGQVGCPQPVVTYKDDTIYHQACSLRVIRTWIATDPVQSNLSASCDQIINLKDEQAPSITCPANITVQSGPDCTGTASWNDPITSDNCSSVRLSGSHGNGTSGFPIGTTTVYYTAFDACGNSSNCSFTVTVEPNCCNKPPVLTCPADFNNCPQGIDPSVTGTATATPGQVGCPQPVVTYKDDTIYHQACSLRVIRTWIATDPVHPNLSASCNQIINLKDEQAPSITCPANITVQSGPDCTGTASWNDPVTSDNCSSVSLSGSHGNGTSGFPIGTTNIYYTAFDACGNSSNCSFTVTVEPNCCNKPPVLTCPADFNNCPQGIDPAVTGTATATPGQAECPQPVVTYKDDTIYHQACSLRVIRTWIATDPVHPNLSASCDQIINLKDEQAPSITCPANITVQSGPDCTGTASWNDPVTSDNCSSVSLSGSHGNGSSGFPIGTTTVYYTAFDACNNSSNCSFTVTVELNCCNKPPVLNCAADFESCPGSIEPSRTGQANAQKAHATCGDPIISYNDQILFQQSCSLKLIRTWYATDSNNSNLKDSCQQYIDLKDDQAPIISDCPVDITIDPNYNCEAYPSWVIPTASDNCTLTNFTGSHLPGELMPSGKTTVIYTATDACGLISSCSFVVTVTENCCNRPPIMICPDNYSACPGSSIDTSVTGVPKVTAGKSTCLDPIITFHDNVISRGPCSGAITVDRTWRAVDPNLPNLFAECTQRIELRDNLAPRFTSTPSNITIDAQGKCEVPVHWLAPVATDNCGLASLTSNINSGSNFNEGTTSVTYTATDQCGNTASTTFTVTVTGTVVGIECPRDTLIYRTNPYLNGAYLNWPLPNVTYCNPCQSSIRGFVYMGEYNGSRYFCSLGPENWETAKTICDINGGKLAVINDRDENQFIASKLAGQTAWIGGSDAQVEGRFDWVDKSPFIYSNWLPGQPNNFGPNEDYIELAPDGTWNDQNGDESREFVLEMPCYDLKQIKGPKRGSLVNCGTNTITYVATKDGQSDTCSFVVRVNCDSLTTYCNNRAQFSNLMWIKQVKIADIDNPSGNDNGYRFFNNPCGNLKAGETYSLCVTPGYLNSSYNVYWKIWIDYNADGVFHNVSELVTYGYGNTTMCANLKMPGGFVRANVRMRVAMSYGAYPADPCAPILYGEIEDYCFNLLPHTNFGSGTTESLEIKAPELKCAQDCDKQSPVELDLRSVEQELFGKQGDFFIIPNPANSEVILKTISDKAKSMAIFDAQGKNVWKKMQPGTEAETINTTTWAEGLYHITVEFTNGNKISKRFIIQH